MKAVQVIGMVLVVLLLMAAPAAAADGDSRIGGSFGAGLGAGITIIGAGWGFGRIGAAALESMARQPEVAGRVQTGMIVIAALLEGATFFALIVCIVAIPTAG